MARINASLLSPLGRRVFTILFVISTCVSFVVSSGLVWLDYQAGVKRHEGILTQIQHSYQDSISYSLWNFDTRQIEAQLQGILNFPGITYAQIDNDGSIIASQGDLYKKADRRLLVPLTYKNNQIIHKLGQLRINQNYDSLYESLINRGFSILASNFVLFLLVSLIVLMVLHKLVTKRIWQMAKWAKNFSLGNLEQALVIDQNPNNEDEFSYVVEAINNMRLTLQEDLTLREKEHQEKEQLQDQLSLAVDNASLGVCRYHVAEEKFYSNSHFARQLGNHDLDNIREPISFLTGQISGSNRDRQIEDIQQLLKGNKVRLHERYILQQAQHNAVLDISFQTVRYNDNSPEVIIICSTDLTNEYLLQHKLIQLTEEKEQELTCATQALSKDKELLLDERKELKQEIIKLRLSQQPKHIKALTSLMAEFIRNINQQQQDPQADCWLKFLEIDFYKRLSTIDIAKLINNITSDTAQRHSVILSKNMPFSIVSEEDPEILTFLVENILDAYLLSNSNELHINLTIENSRLTCCWSFLTTLEAEAVSQTLPFKLANVVSKIRYNGSLSCYRRERFLDISFSSPFRT